MTDQGSESLKAINYILCQRILICQAGNAMNAIKNLFGFGMLAGAFVLLLLVSRPAHPQATLTINFSASDITAIQPACQTYMNLGATPTNAQLKTCNIILITRFVQSYSVSSQGAAITAVPFNPQ